MPHMTKEMFSTLILNIKFWKSYWKQKVEPSSKFSHLTLDMWFILSVVYFYCLFMKQGVKSYFLINLSRFIHLNNKWTDFNTVSTEKRHSEHDKGESFPSDLHANFQLYPAMCKVKTAIWCLPCQFNNPLFEYLPYTT